MSDSATHTGSETHWPHEELRAEDRQVETVKALPFQSSLLSEHNQLAWSRQRWNCLSA